MMPSTLSLTNPLTLSIIPRYYHTTLLSSSSSSLLSSSSSLLHRSISSLSSSSSLSSLSSLSSFSSRLPHSSPFSSSPYSHRSFSTHKDGVPFIRKPPANLGVVIVPQQEAYVIERLGKFSRVLSPGLHFLIPIFDRIAYVHSLKEEAINIPNQQAITMDNVTITIDGVLYLRVIDAVYASYGVSNLYYAMTQLAQTTMRSELGKMTLDKTFAERESLNAAIVRQINKAAEPWGIQCLRYEIRDISPPDSVKQAMDMQAEAERKKRATILDSEGAQQAEINIADGQRQSITLQAQGEAAAILTRAEATAKGIEHLALAVRKTGGKEAVALKLAEQYVNAFSNLAKETNTILLPSNPADPASMVASALTMYQQLLNKTPLHSSSSSPSSPVDINNTEGSAEPSSTANDQEANEALLQQLLRSRSAQSSLNQDK